MSNAEIARRLGMAASGIFERIKKLEERGTITGYTALVDPVAVELGLLAYVFVRTEDPVGGDATARALAKRPEIQEVHQRRYMECMKGAIIASLRGAAPATAVEFGRKVIFHDERPSFTDTDKALQSLKAS